MIRRHTLILAFVVASLVAACAPSGGGLGSLPPGASPDPSVPQGSPDLTPQPSAPASPSQEPSQPGGGSPPPDPSEEPSGTTIVRAYFILAGEADSEGLVPVLREVPATVAVARAAMLALLDGPTADEANAGIGSAIPDGTGLLGISIEGGVATVDLSGQFATGGGSASTIGRLGQVVYTLTQFPTVESVAFRVDGQVVEVFGSEGLILDGPQDRGDYGDLLPAIWVDRPAWGAAIGNPGRVTGSADVFEATFIITLLDADGQVVYEQPAMATCGTGCRGTFDEMVSYEVDRAQWGTLRVWAGSAQDGSPIHVREYPVWLTPGG